MQRYLIFYKEGNQIQYYKYIVKKSERETTEATNIYLSAV